MLTHLQFSEMQGSVHIWIQPVIVHNLKFSLTSISKREFLSSKRTPPWRTAMLPRTTGDQKMSKLEEKLAAMGYTLPEPFTYPSPNRQGCVQVGNILFVSGHGRNLPDGIKSDGAGKVGVEVTLEEGYEAAKHTVLSMLASAKAHCGGDLDRIKRVIRLIGMVNCSADFELQPRVIDGASDLVYELFGPEYGCHVRSAVGMGSLPHRIPVEINGEFELWE